MGDSPLWNCSPVLTTCLRFGYFFRLSAMSIGPGTISAHVSGHDTTNDMVRKSGRAWLRTGGDLLVERVEDVDVVAVLEPGGDDHHARLQRFEGGTEHTATAASE